MVKILRAVPVQARPLEALSDVTNVSLRCAVQMPLEIDQLFVSVVQREILQSADTTDLLPMGSIQRLKL